MNNSYIEGILTAYDRVMQMMNIVDPEKENDSFNYIRDRMLASILGYKDIIKESNVTKTMKSIFEKYHE